MYVHSGEEVYLETGYTIVVGNQDMLSVVCGANDTNLRLLEDYLGVPVVTKGNELTVASSNEVVCRKFQELVEKLLSCSANNNEASSDLLTSLIATIDEPLSADVHSQFIHIPQGLKKVYPKTTRQAEYIHKIKTHELVFCLGPAGTGKTYIAVADALRQLLSHEVRKMVLTRPVVEAGENLGFLPGDLEQKIHPYIRPLYDAMESLIPVDTIRRLEESGMIEVAPLAYMRGRSLQDAVIILDEAQNTTREQMKMFLTRLGQGSRAIITGDPTQVDLPRSVLSGLGHAVHVLRNVPDIAIIMLENRDVVRSQLVKKIVQAYEQEENTIS